MNFGCELFVFEIGRKQQFDKRIAKKELIAAVVESEAHFVKISREMFRRDFMPRTHNAAFEKRESRFDGIGMNVAVSVFAGVVNRLVLACRDVPECPMGTTLQIIADGLLLKNKTTIVLIT